MASYKGNNREASISQAGSVCGMGVVSYTRSAAPAAAGGAGVLHSTHGSSGKGLDTQMYHMNMMPNCTGYATVSYPSAASNCGPSTFACRK